MTSRDMADAHATAEARDARDPDAFHREWLHVMDTQHPHTPQESDMDDRKNTTDQCQADPRTHSEKALDLIADRLRDVVLELRVGPIPDTLAEIRDRLPERPTLYTLEGVAAEFGVDLSDEPADITERNHIMSHPTTTLALLDALQEKWHQRYMALSAKDSEKRVGQAVSEAANDLGDIIEAYESERLDPQEPADITEEPPVGSQVTDCEGDVWEQVGAGWQAWDRRASMWGGSTGWGSSAGPRSHAPLRPTTDADRERVGLVDLEPKAELDEVEALAKVLRLTACRPGFSFPWEAITQEARDEYLNLARAAREFIEAEVLRKVERATDDRYDRVLDRANKAEAKAVDYEERYECSHATNMAAQSALVRAEANLARVTDARDRHSRSADKWCNLYADKCEEIESVQAKADRYDALREDGALAKAILHSLDFPPSSLLGEAVTAAVTDVLAAHGRAES